jgi:hypothetical protein
MTNKKIRIWFTHQIKHTDKHTLIHMDVDTPEGLDELRKVELIIPKHEETILQTLDCEKESQQV